MLVLFVLFLSLCVATASSDAKTERRALIFIVAAVVLLAVFACGYFWFKSENKPILKPEAAAAGLSAEQEAAAALKAQEDKAKFQAALEKKTFFNQKLEKIKTAEYVHPEIYEALKMCALNDFFNFGCARSTCSEISKIIDVLEKLYYTTVFVNENGEEEELQDMTFEKTKGILICVANNGICYAQQPPIDMMEEDEDYVFRLHNKTFYNRFFCTSLSINQNFGENPWVFFCAE